MKYSYAKQEGVVLVERKEKIKWEWEKKVMMEFAASLHKFTSIDSSVIKYWSRERRHLVRYRGTLKCPGKLTDHDVSVFVA